MLHKRYLTWFSIVIILLLAAFLRLYRINDYMAFLGDEGRDVLIVKRMIIDHQFTLLGPITSIGLMHLGPIYYYFMIPFLWVSGLHPVGPAIMVALFSVATVALLWQFGREFFDTKTGLIAALLYTFSPLVLTYSHSSWNPNILPFWALLLIYSLTKAVVKREYWWLFVTGACLGIVLQLHYVALVFILIITTILTYIHFDLPKKYLLGAVAGCILLLSPFILFELRHDFINTKTVFEFIVRTDDQKSFGLVSPINKYWDLTVRMFWRLIVVRSAELSIFFLITVLATCVFLLFRWPKNEPKRHVLMQLLIWYVVGIGMLSFYTGTTYDYYLMFVFPLPFLLTAIALRTFMKIAIGAVAALAILLTIVSFQWQLLPLHQAPNRLVAQTKEIADFILKKTEHKPYNFALIAGKNSDHAYRYFLEIGGQPPVVIENPNDDPQRKSVTNQLFVVCEDKECKPLGHPLWEIAGFGRAEIIDEWSVGLFRVFKLVTYKSES